MTALIAREVRRLATEMPDPLWHDMLMVIPYSQDRKLGGMAATYRPVGFTCHLSCPLMGTKKKRGPCYALRGLVNFNQFRSARRSDSLTRAAGVDMIRHLVSGDVFWQNQLDVPLVEKIFGFHKEFKRTKGALYTHFIQAWEEAGITPDTVPKNLQVLASVDSSSARARARLSGWRTARTIHRPDEVEEGERLCPYDLAKHLKKKPISVTCRSCKLCWRAKGPDIAFIKF